VRTGDCQTLIGGGKENGGLPRGVRHNSDNVRKDPRKKGEQLRWPEKEERLWCALEGGEKCRRKGEHIGTNGGNAA